MPANHDPTRRDATARGAATPARRLLAAVRERLHPARGEDGFLLIEVMVSALLVAMIVVATFNGLDAATQLTNDQRRHDEAAILAAQSQEQLRSEPAGALNALVSSPRKYTATVGGTTFTIIQRATNVGSGGKTTGCSVSAAKANTGTNFQVSSTVSWLLQEQAHRPAVTAAGVVTPPTGSAVEVDVTNGLAEGVSGVTAKATFIPVESGSYDTVEGTTGTEGCVVLTGIQSTKATIEIVEKTGFVTPTGALKVQPKELTIAPNVTTHYAVQYAEAGRIEAHFTYKGATTFEGKEVVGDTFVAANNGGFGVKPEYETGATAFKYEATGEENFLPLTAKALSSALPSQSPYIYRPNAWTAASSRYPAGDLFPFKSNWQVYAGDCAANDTGPEAVGEAEPVTSATTDSVNVPMSLTTLSIWEGQSQAKHGEPVSKGYGPVKITNTECESASKPPNASGTAYTHEQKETLPAGRLEEPFQPFGKFSLCLVDSEEKQTYTVSFTNSTAAGSTPNIYLGQRPNAEVSAERAKAQAEMKTYEAYKEKGGYSTKGAEAAKEKENYEKWLATYTSDKSKYETELAAYTTAKSKYETEKTAYTNDKSKYETEKTAYTNDKSKYETKKKEYETKKKEYEKNKKSKEKEEYEKDKTEYLKFESEYKTAETAYLKFEGEYKAAETAYKKFEGEYKTAETAYKTFKTAYEKDETEYKKFKSAYEKDEEQAAEYQGYLKYNAAKTTYTTATAEEEENSKSGVTVEAATKC